MHISMEQWKTSEGTSAYGSREQAREIARYQEELKDPSISEERREDLER